MQPGGHNAEQTTRPRIRSFAGGALCHCCADLSRLLYLGNLMTDDNEEPPSDSSAFGLGLVAGLVLVFLLAVVAYIWCSTDRGCRQWLRGTAPSGGCIEGEQHMTCYVDDMFRHPMGQFRGMKMSHMIADTEAELHRMATKLGLKRVWFQGDHYDVSKGVRGMAIAYGAREVSMRELGAILFCQKAGWSYTSPNDALNQMMGIKANGRRAQGDAGGADPDSGQRADERVGADGTPGRAKGRPRTA